MTHPLCEIRLKVNGEEVRAKVPPRLLLSDFLRNELRLTGTHVGCEHGICGACTIFLNGEAARSCLMFAAQADGEEITTIEGLSESGAIRDLQEAFAQHHALQCGFCTPGMLAVAHDLLTCSASPSDEEIKDGMSAAICRCTGYLGIIEAVKQVAAARRQRSDQGETR
jgi:aerobic-type carbon monoxide dehydrogenase small subunit (CoxS/CutS family)